MRLEVYGCVALLCSAVSQASHAQGDVNLELEKACRNGIGRSCEALGTLYLHGSGVPKSDSKAADLYRQACDYGNKEGCRYLGALHALGKGVTQDYGRAAAYYQKACGGGDSHSCRMAEIAKADKEREESLRTPSPPAVSTRPPIQTTREAGTPATASPARPSKYKDPVTDKDCVLPTGNEASSTGNYVYVRFHNSCGLTFVIWGEAFGKKWSTGIGPYKDSQLTISADQISDLKWWFE